MADSSASRNAVAKQPAASSTDLIVVLARLADMHTAAAQAGGNAAADRTAAALEEAGALLAGEPDAAALAALRASMGTMLDALQAQDRVSQTLDLVRRVIVAAGLAHSGAAASSGEALLRDIARRSQAVQPGIAAEVAALIEQHLAGPAPE